MYWTENDSTSWSLLAVGTSERYHYQQRADHFFQIRKTADLYLSETPLQQSKIALQGKLSVTNYHEWDRDGVM